MSSNTNEGSIQVKFIERCDELLDVMVEQAHNEDSWDVYLAKGAGDRAIAGDHEERHLLELFQNARDAIYRGRIEGDHTPGRIYVAVTERGMAMANTGASFRLDDENVLKAVRFLMRSNKAGSGFIGHKGIGLKSILLRAGAFSIRSRVDGQVLRATFSRHRTAKHLLDEIRARPNSFSTHWHVLRELPRLPLFTQPHPDRIDRETLATDTELIEHLIGENKEQAPGLDAQNHIGGIKPYTTIVYLPYREEEWEVLLDSTARVVREEGEKDAERAYQHAREQMGTTSNIANADAVWRELIAMDPRVFILLGDIAEIQFGRFQDGKLIEARRIDVNRPLSPLDDPQGNSLKQVTLTVKTWGGQDATVLSSCRTFVILSAPTNLGVESDVQQGEGPPEQIRVLLEVPSSGRVQIRDEPLFLYYPIDSDKSGMPFVIHGPFRVNSSRTALVPSQKDHNQQVLEQAVKLVGDCLDDLLALGNPLRPWLPWLLLPVVHAEDEPGLDRDRIRQALIQDVVGLLRNQPCVPTTQGNVRPQDVYFFPSHPDTLVLLEDLKQPHTEALICLMAPENRQTYLALHAAAQTQWEHTAHLIGLGQIDLMSFVTALSAYLCQIEDKEFLSTKASHARSFFLGLCTVLVGEDGKLNRAAAAVFGKYRVPLLPAFAGDAQDIKNGDRLLLVRAEPLREGSPADAQQASRVVFWRPSGIKTRVEQIQPPPSTIPIYFIDPSTLEADGGRAEGILSALYDEWGTTRFESRPDLFRRVADRTIQLEDEAAIPVLGYLAGVLSAIFDESFSGAEDLQPRPYAAIDLELVRTLLSLAHRSANQRRLDRQRLQSFQRWARIPVPVRRSTPAWDIAERTVFGPEWASVLEVDETDDSEHITDEQQWAEAIGKLAVFRKRVGRSADDPCYPEIAPPDDSRWTSARRQVQRLRPDLTHNQVTRALFDLLLLIGVRIGPRVTWRWLNNQPQTERFDPTDRTINLETTRHLFTGDPVPEATFPVSLTQSNLMQRYRRHLCLRPYHPAFTSDHSWGCRHHMQRTGAMQSRLAAWIWLPDLAESDLDGLPFEGKLDAIDAFRETIVAFWPAFAKQVMWSGWYCEGSVKKHKGRSWWHSIPPSLAAFQLSQLALWAARPDGRLTETDARRFPASVMLTWDREPAPSATDPPGFFPLMDIRTDPMPQVAKDLGVATLPELSFHGAVIRLRWLLKESHVRDGPSGCWHIAEFAGTSRDAWLAAQYRLLDRIVHHDPEDLWHRRTIATCGFALRAVRGDVQCAVPVIEPTRDQPRFAIDVAFFPQPPRYWEREANAERWILESQRQIQTALYRWAETMDATRLSRTDPPAYEGTPVSDPETVAALQREVRRRLVLLLGTFKAHRAEQLDRSAQQVLGAIEEMVPVKAASRDKGWSGLDADGRLVFSIDDYHDERQFGRTGAVVLAEGLALLVNQTTAVGDLQHALGAPEDQVRRALHFRGVDLNEVIREVGALARERVSAMLARIERLVQALAEATNSSVELPDWQTGEIAEDTWIEAVEELSRVEGPLAAQALKLVITAAEDLPEPSCRALLQLILEEGLAARTSLSTVHSLLSVLRKACWTAEQRVRFVDSESFALPADLAKHEQACDTALIIAVVAGLIERLVSGELDGAEDVASELIIRSQEIQRTTQAPAGEVDRAFLGRIASAIGVVPEFDAPDLLLIEWTEETWLALGQAFREAAQTYLEQLPEDLANLRAILARCLQMGSLDPLRENRIQQQDERRSRIRALEHGIASGTLSFDLQAFPGPGAAPLLGRLTSETREPGQRSTASGIGIVTADQAVRGRMAELFVLEVCWHRFLSLDSNDRKEILDAVTTCRQGSPGDVPWGTAAAWKRLKRRPGKQRVALLSYSPEESASPELARLFKDLIEVADERGPGFDVLDPFGVWGTERESLVSPRRVEVKAILAPGGSSNGHRIVLSTNEFHRARQHPGSYVLRLIHVPGDQAVSGVRWACDVPDPVGALHLDEQLVLGVRSGILPFLVHPTA